MMLYNIPAFDTSKEFMIAVARVRGRVKKGGVPDLVGAARSILRDWNAGRIPFYTIPPAVPISSSGKPHSSAATVMTSGTDIGSASIATSLAPEFDLDSLFKQADSIALEGVKSSKESSFVRMNESMATEDAANEEGDDFAYKLMGEKDDEDIELDVVDDMAAIISAKAKGKKRKSDVQETTVVTTAPNLKSKRVNFEDGSTPGGGKVGTSNAKVFADAPEEAPIQLNKDIKKQAKKAKKDQRKVVKKAEKEENDLSNAFGSVALKKSTDQDDDETLDDAAAPKPYDFTRFFSGQ
jgi:nuclear GTP-binding protein